MVLNKNSNSILVTGGAGFIGSNIVQKLINEKNKVIVFDNFLRGKKNNFDSKNIKIINGDIRKINDLNKIKTKIDTVIHLAYLNGTKYFYDNPDLVLDIGIKGLGFEDISPPPIRAEIVISLIILVKTFARFLS